MLPVLVPSGLELQIKASYIVHCCFYSGLLLTSVGMMDEDVESLKICIGALNVETFERAPTSLFGFAHG